MSVIEHSDDESNEVRVLRAMTEFVKRDPDAAAAQLIRQEVRLFDANVRLQGAVSETERLRLRIAALEGAFNSLRNAARDIGAMADRADEHLRGQ